MDDFDVWWGGSKYTQVIYAGDETRQVALDGWEAALRRSPAEALLRDLVKALDTSFISSWQSTAGWRKELDAAREYVEQSNES